MGNITNAFLRFGTVTKTQPLYQYDYGQVLKFTGVELPATYEVHFSNTQHGVATTMIGGPDGVTIPDMYLTTGADVYVWLYLHTGNADGETEYNCIIPVISRASISDAPPTPVQQDVITQAIAALNSATEHIDAADAAAENADEKAALAADKAELADQAASSANAAATLANDKAALANEKAALADQKAALADQKAIAANTAASAATTAAQNANNAATYVAPVEASSTASAAHIPGTSSEYFIYNGSLYIATADIDAGDTIVTTGTGANAAQVPGGAMGEVADLKSAIGDFESIKPTDLSQWLYAENKYLNASYELTTLSGYNTYRIPVEALDFVLLMWNGDDPLGGLVSTYLYALEDDNGMRRNLGDANYCRDATRKHVGFIAPSNSIALYLTFQTSKIASNLTVVKNNSYTYSLNSNYQSNFILPINGLTAANPAFYIDSNALIKPWGDASGYRTWWIKVTAGDVISFAESESDLTANASYVDSTGARNSITSLTHTFASDAVVVAFEKTDKTNNISLSQNALKLKISSDDVIGLGDAIDEQTASLATEISAVDDTVDGIETQLSAAPVSYTAGDTTGYYKIKSGTTDEIEIYTSATTFTCKEVAVQPWMYKVDLEILSTSGLAYTAIFCGFTDQNDRLISKVDVEVGEYSLAIPSNATHIILNFFGNTYCTGYTIQPNAFITQSMLDNLGVEGNPWDQLTGVAFGTSLTYRAITNYGFLSYLSELSGITFDNQGVGSATILGDGGSLDMLAKIKAYTGYSGKRVALLEGFVNDWYGNNMLGTWEDTGETTVCGCVRSAINYMLSQNANLTVFLILDHVGRNHSGLDCSSTATRGAGITQYEYYSEIEKVANSLGIPVIKEYAGSQISENTPQYLADNIHCTALGAKQSGKFIWSKMRAYYPNAIS